MKRLIIGVVVLIVVLVGGFFAAVMTLNSIDWSEYEEPIAAAVKDATGRELRFSGALNVNISLSPGVSAQGITLQNADWAGRDDMLTLDHVEVHLKLLPLIFGQIELSRLEIFGLNLSLQTDRQGKGNWEFELAGGDTPTAADTEPATGDGSLLTAAVLTRAVIRDATVIYTDGVTGDSQQFSIVELIARMDSVSAPLIIDLDATYGNESVELAGEINGLKDLLAGGPLDLDLTVGVLGATVLIDGAVGKPLEADGIEMVIEVSGDSLGRLTEFADVQVTGLGAYRVAAKISGNGESMAVADLDVRLEAAGAQVQATGGITDVIAVTGIDVALGVKGDSLAALSPLIETELPDLGAYRFAANIAGTAERFEVTDLSIGLADSQIEGKLNADIATEPMRIRASLNAQKIDLSRLLPAEEVATDRPQDESAERLFPDDPLPLDAFDALETIDAVVDIAIGELIVDPETTATDIGVKVTAAAKKILIKPLKLDVMGASVGGYVDLKVVDKVAKVDTKFNISHPNAGDLVTDEEGKMMTGGPLDMKIRIKGAGASVRDIMASSNGFVKVELGAAQANSQWIKQIFSQVEALLTKRAGVPGEDDPLELNCVIIDFKIREGIARAESFVVDTRGISLFGDGSVDLGTEALDLNFDWLVAGISNKTTLPTIKLRGTLMSPTGKLDTKKAIGNVLGLGDGAVTESDFEAAGVTAAAGPERCRQRLVVYEQVREERSRPKEVTVDSLKKDVDTVKESLKNLGGLFKKKR